MPLDTGSLGERSTHDRDKAEIRRRIRAILGEDHRDIGATLRCVREARGLSPDDIFRTIKVRPSHITAIETLDVEKLPSHPFALGYVRSYAGVLGLETEAVVRRFVTEAPEPDEDRRATITGGRAGGSRWVIAIVAMLIAAVVGRNIGRHFETRGESARAGSRAAVVAGPALALGPVRLGAPLPAPPEASPPPVYQTPGLLAAGETAAPAAAKAPPSAGPTVDAGEAGARFVAARNVYTMAGSPAGTVILQATKPASLIVRGENGAVYFARQLATGEAWRAPAMAGLSADVDDPSAMEVFVGGVSRGVLSAGKTSLDKLGG